MFLQKKKKKKKKKKKYNFLIMIAQNYYKLTQMTYLRQNRHDQVKILERYAFSRSSIISIANAKSLCKIHFGHKKVQVGKDQEKAQSEKDSHSKNRDGKKLN